MKKVYLDDGPKAIAMDCKRCIVMFIDTVDGPIKKNVRLSVEIAMKTAEVLCTILLMIQWTRRSTKTKSFSGD